LRIFVATSNPGKLADFSTAAEVHGIQVLPLLGITSIDPPEETGTTFEENARIKAEFYSRCAAGEIVFADDSGFCVDALGGAPGVRSARYAEDAGITSDDPGKANNRLLLDRADRIPDLQRQAAFICVIAAARDGKTLQTFYGEARGLLLRAPCGANGFGYDPLFYFPELKKSFAELSREEKLKVSHRGEAFRKLLAWLIAT
jgi:XTP/dITP diphosphohydrolase